MDKTISQVLSSFESFANSYPNIAQFVKVEPTTFTAKGYKFPLLFVAVGNSVVTQGEIRTSFDCYFLDKGTESNYTQKLSQMLVIGEDFFTYFNKNYAQFGFQLEDTITVEPKKFSYEDILFGYRFPLVVKTRSSENEYNVPI